MSFLELVSDYYPRFLTGIGMTLGMTLFSLIIAMILGLVSCLFAISKVKILRGISRVYVDLIRGTPLLVQIFMIYFGLTS
ncbi:MAG: ABC transporter permease subunit, partial [Lachnospiraceae bacterium]|nr:ABC transporter permease subunit [Lachnospiraceae bacterium]